MELKRSDNTNPHRKMRRHTRKCGGVRYKTIIWFEEVGAERIPQKSINVMRSAYKKTLKEYWRTLDPLYIIRAQRMRMYTKNGENDND
jgi:hypothetical protein